MRYPLMFNCRFLYRFPADIRVFEQYGRGLRFPAQADDDDMDVRVVRGLRVPCERAVRETDMPAVRMQRFEQGFHGLPLGDRIGGDECERRIRFRQVGGGLPVPSGRVVEISVILAAPHGLQIIGLTGGLGDVSDERRVAHHIVAVVAG